MRPSEPEPNSVRLLHLTRSLRMHVFMARTRRQATGRRPRAWRAAGASRLFGAASQSISPSNARSRSCLARRLPTDRPDALCHSHGGFYAAARNGPWRQAAPSIEGEAARGARRGNDAAMRFERIGVAILEMPSIIGTQGIRSASVAPRPDIGATRTPTVRSKSGKPGSAHTMNSTPRPWRMRSPILGVPG